MSKEKKIVTVYGTFFYERLSMLGQWGGGEYTADELAEMFGLKLTHNFRKRCHEAVQLGHMTYAEPRKHLPDRRQFFIIPKLQVNKNDVSDIPF